MAFWKRAAALLLAAFASTGATAAYPHKPSRLAIAQGADPAFLGAEDFSKYLAAEMPRWADAVRKSGVRLD